MQTQKNGRGEVACRRRVWGSPFLCCGCSRSRRCIGGVRHRRLELALRARSFCRCAAPVSSDAPGRARPPSTPTQSARRRTSERAARARNVCGGHRQNNAASASLHNTKMGSPASTPNQAATATIFLCLRARKAPGILKGPGAGGPLSRRRHGSAAGKDNAVGKRRRHKPPCAAGRRAPQAKERRRQKSAAGKRAPQAGKRRRPPTAPQAKSAAGKSRRQRRERVRLRAYDVLSGRRQSTERSLGCTNHEDR